MSAEGPQAAQGLLSGSRVTARGACAGGSFSGVWDLARLGLTTRTSASKADVEMASPPALLVWGSDAWGLLERRCPLQATCKARDAPLTCPVVISLMTRLRVWGPWKGQRGVSVSQGGGLSSEVQETWGSSAALSLGQFPGPLFPHPENGNVGARLLDSWEGA